jgi:cobalamin biosynthesis Mg chelatase CobN
MAFYRWLRDDFKADAVVHVGTHGTLDLMPEDPTDVDAIAAELVRLKTSLMPLGFHLIGQGFSPDEATSFVAAILAWDRGELSALPGIIKAALPKETPEIHLEERAWEDESDLARGFIGAQKHLYSRNRRGQAQLHLFESNLKDELADLRELYLDMEGEIEEKNE